VSSRKSSLIFFNDYESGKNVKKYTLKWGKYCVNQNKKAVAMIPSQQLVGLVIKTL